MAGYGAGRTEMTAQPDVVPPVDLVERLEP
jgi:hypothetical protein